MPNAAFYQTPEWRSIRRSAIQRDRYRCVVCHASVAGRGEARVDHIRRLEDGGAPLDLANLRTLCTLHDNQSHREKGTGGGQRVERFTLPGADEDGVPIDPAHHWHTA